MTVTIYRQLTSFPQGVNAGSLQEALDSVGLGCRGVAVASKSVVMVFDNEPEAAALEAVLSAHTGAPVSVCKIFRYVQEHHNESEPPFEIDFIRGLSVRLHREDVFGRGELVRTNWWANATRQPDGTIVYEDAIIYEVVLYTYDANLFVQTRTRTITYVREDESDHPLQKSSVKVYPTQESLRAGQRRRTNIIDELRMTVLGVLLQAMPATAWEQGRAFSLAHQSAITEYIDVANQQLIADVQSDAAFAWLETPIAPGVTLRDKLVSDLDIWS